MGRTPAVERRRAHVSEDELDWLAAWLASDQAPVEAMDISELDGFLTGLAVAPRGCVPADWATFAFGLAGEAEAEDPRLSRALDIAERRLEDIRRELREDPQGLAPVLWSEEDGSVDASSWAAGFVEAMQFHPEAWDPAFRDEDGFVALTTILAVATGGELPEGIQVEDEEVLSELLAQGPEIVATCALVVDRVLRRAEAASGPDGHPSA